MWAIGVATFILLGGYPPFHDDGKTKNFHNQMKTGQFEFEPEYWMHISAAAKELIRGLLTVNAAQRLTVDQALAHPWVSWRA